VAQYGANFAAKRAFSGRIARFQRVWSRRNPSKSSFFAAIRPQSQTAPISRHYRTLLRKDKRSGLLQL
jgi:hypothetical protein